MTERRNLRYPSDWIRRKKYGIPVSVITAYDYTEAKLISRTTADALLTGDSLAMTVQGLPSTLSVTLDEIIYHTKLVRRGAPSSFVIADMPFGSFQCGINEAVKNGIRIIKETDCSAVKIEGFEDDTLRIIERLTSAGVPVMGHAGLTPQSYLTLGGYAVQGKDDSSRKILLERSRMLQDAGCFSLVLELIDPDLACEITRSLEIPTIGIGSGSCTDGQVQVLHDLLGLDPDFSPKHARKYADLAALITDAVQRYDDDVKGRRFNI